MVAIKSNIPLCLNISQKLQTHSFTSFIVLTYHRIKGHCCSLFPCLPVFGEVIFSFMFKKKRYTAGLVGLPAFSWSIRRKVKQRNNVLWYSLHVPRFSWTESFDKLILLLGFAQPTGKAKEQKQKPATPHSLPPAPWEASPGASFPLTNADPCAACLSA